MDFYEEFLRLLRPRVKQSERIIVCGDVNTPHRKIDLARPRTIEKTSGFLLEERDWVSCFLAAGFVDTFRHFHPEARERYSWWSFRWAARERNLGWRIDYFLVTENLVPALRAADINDEVQGSDHCRVSLKL